MPTKPIKKSHKQFLKALGRSIERKILDELGYKSLDAFSLTHHDNITKKTLYDLCSGNRDLKLTTLLGLAEALGEKPSELLRKIQ